jgi:hypothetical protein
MGAKDAVFAGGAGFAAMFAGDGAIGVGEAAQGFGHFSTVRTFIFVHRHVAYSSASAGAMR